MADKTETLQKLEAYSRNDMPQNINKLILCCSFALPALKTHR